MLLVISNASDNPDGKGIETFYNKQKQLNDDVLAELIQQAGIEQISADNRGVKRENYTVIIKTDMPAVLVEVGFLSNETERELLQDESYQKKLATGIAHGILEYL